MIAGLDVTREGLEQAARLVYAALPPTPQYEWPLLSRALGAEVWVKHENHTPVGAFKVRGGLVYVDGLRGRLAPGAGLISATRGNHGQSIAYAARRHGLRATIVVPHGNSVEKNAAMRALGADLIEYGDDFQEALEHAQGQAQAQGWHLVPSFHPDLVRGVATGWVEFLRAAEPEVAYVPVGLGSGLCAAALARAATGVRTRLIGVVSAHATAYLDSWRARAPVNAPVSTRLADGMACRQPNPQALEILLREADDIVAVTDDEVAQAMRLMFSATHNVAEGAGAAALAAARQQAARWQGRRVGVMLSGGNVDRPVFAQVLAAGA